MSEFKSSLENAMESHGFFIQGSINYNSDKIQRFKNRNKVRGGQDIFVALHDYRGATFGDWHNKDGWVTWWLNASVKISVHEEADRRERTREIEQRRLKMRKIAINRALRLWDKGTTDTDEQSYIKKKRIRGYYSRQIKQLRWIKDTLLIPIRNIDYEFQGVQIIKPNGFKRLWKGTSQKDNMIWLSPPLPDNYDGVIRVCEGYATGCTIYETIGSPVICAINANNLVNVMQLLRQKYPKYNLKICADNDQWSGQNSGLICALNAENVSGAIIYYPTFNQSDVREKPTDFNDLMCLNGIEEVERQLTLIRSK